MRRLLRTVLVLLGLAALAFAVPAARADVEVEVGDRAPAFRGRAFVNTGPVDLASLSGRVVVLEMFRTRVAQCREPVARLDELQAKYGARGLVVISLTIESRSVVEKFVAETKAAHAFVSEKTDSAWAYGVGSFPFAFLVDPDGVIAWYGHPDNLMPDIVEKELRRVRLPPPLPEAMAPVRKLLDARKYGEARKALARAVADEKTPAGDRAAATKAIEWIDAHARRLTDLATVDSIKGEYLSAADALERLAEEFRGTEAGDRAAKELREILADPVRKKEIEAQRKFPDVKEQVLNVRPKKAAELLKAFLAAYPGTKAAAEAEKLLEEVLRAGDR